MVLAELAAVALVVVAAEVVAVEGADLDEKQDFDCTPSSVFQDECGYLRGYENQYEIPVVDDNDMVLQMGSLEEQYVIEEDECLLNRGPTDRKVLYLGAAPNRYYPFSLFSEDCGWKEIGNIVLSRTKVVFFSNKINLLVPCGPLAVLVDLVTGHQGSVFLLSLLGTIPLAERLVGGLLNATFGNATELIISIHAMKSGMIRVVQQSLLGSILSNMLLVLGSAFFSGGIVHSNKEQVFNKANAEINTGLLLVAVMGLLFPAVLHFTRTELHFGKSELALSRFSSCVMLVGYVAFICFQLIGQRNVSVTVNEDESEADGSSDDKEAPKITKWESIIWLFILTASISFLSEYLVNAIEEKACSEEMLTSLSFALSKPFYGMASTSCLLHISLS
ncbi:hypothetical protein RHGRI_018142 [Rhododendron griersonianum]|uniref:Sodium/calcium exchanger membrane region domain-containing protein n=1 Tax=Rhododendron griersonianum TaxID=479676 RepID=A0AAV6K0F8_9ERIC|nr:hypothetical protein RHGRI_018142 [Rhododendron griersonianum]